MDTLIRILHLEDDPADAEFVRAKLAGADLACRITLARTRDEFEAALDVGRTDIILADYRLPGYDGVSALRLATERCPEIPFIFVSGTMGEEAAIEALTQGAIDYVLKHNLSRLALAVQRALQEASNRREHKQAQEALQRSNDMLRAIIKAAPVAIIGLDTDGNVQSVWNPAAEKMLGWSAQEVMGRPLPMVPADCGDEFGRFREQIRKGVNLDGLEVCRRRRDGTPIDYSIYASPLHDAKGRISGDIAVLVDITERKRADEALRASEARYFDLYENAPDMYASVNARTATIEKCNQTLADTLGYPKAEIIGRSVFDIYHPDCLDRAEAAFQKFIESGSIHDTELQLRKKDGAKLDISLNVSAVRAEDGTIVSSRSTLRDITERRRNSMINAARIHLMQYAVTHPLEELLEETINEAEKVTESLIGFHHFVDDDQQALTLQNWSTRTKTQFCSAQGKGLHYRIADAGVWVDCVRERKPVIHNDYNALTHRKGLPEGHAEVIRELVVPVMRGEKVKAILGVGNKPAGYSQKDAEAMSLLADLVWEITERKQAEQKVALMSFALNSIHEAAFMIDEKARFQYINDEACRVLGYTRDELLSMSVPDVCPELPMERWPDHWSDLRGNGALTFEGELKTRNGRLFPVEINANYFEYHGLSYDLGLARDITERRKAEIRLNEQLHFLQQLLDSIPLPVYYKDQDGLYLGCNAAFEAFFGLQRNAIVGKTVHQVVPKERADKHHEADLALLSHPGGQTYEISGIYHDGQHRDVIFNKATFVDANGCVAGTVGTLVDITDRKEAERGRLATLRFFESMDKVNQAIQKADGLEQMMKAVLDVVLLILDCDRAYLLYPCEPEAETWTVPMESSKPGYAGHVYTQRLEMPMQPTMAEMLRILIEADGPVTYGPGGDHQLPPHVWERYGFQSMISTALHPKTGKAWQFGIHQSSYARTWTPEEEMLVREIGRRLSDALSSLLSYRDLRKSEEFLDNVIEHIPDMIFVKEAQSLRFVRFNKAGEQLVGYPREKMIGKTDHDVFPREVATFFTAKDQEVLDSKELVDIAEKSIRNRNNEERILHTKKIPILDETGAPQYVLGISEDITERKQAEESIRKLSQAIEQSPVSIVITDVKGRIEFVNAKFTQITGYTYAEALGKNPSILKSGETPAEEYHRLWKTISTGGVWQGEFHNRKKNGELFWEQATIAPVRDADNVISHYVAVKEDITERKQLEEQLRKVQKMEAIGQLAGGIAHDFNNILSAITGYTEISRSMMEPGSPVSDYLAQVLEASVRAKELINQILMFSRETEQELKPIRLSLPVKEALKLIRASVPATIEIRSEILSQASSLADPTQIHQIVMNLCTNAAHAMREHGGCLDIRLTDIIMDQSENRKLYPDAKPGEYIRLSVSDQGHGIDTYTIHRIFDPFFTTKEKGEGTGMGLSVVHGIVKSYGGFIYVRSHPGKGTTFDILIPALESAVTADLVLEKPIPMGSESILFVDDETMIVDVGKSMLESLGYRVIAKSSPIEALETFCTNPESFDLVVTDMIMPKMTGLDLAEKIIRIRPNIPIIMCTGFGATISEEKGIRHGVRDIIFKPILRRDMAAAIRKALDES